MTFTPESHYCCECMAFFMSATFLKREYNLKVCNL